MEERVTVEEVNSCQVLLKIAKESTTKGKGTAGRKKQQQQKKTEVGRPVRSTDVHNVHRI